MLGLRSIYVVRFVYLLVGVILLMPTSFVHANEVVYDRILVKINDSIITQYDLDEEMKPRSEERRVGKECRL